MHHSVRSAGGLLVSPIRFVLLTFVLLTLLSFTFAAGAAAQSRPQEAKQPAGSISGRVTMNGQAAAGVAVMLIRADTPQRTAAAKATTDEDGRYQFTGVAAGRYEVSPSTLLFVSADEKNFGRDIGKTVTVDDAEAAEGIDFALVRGGVITGRVTDGEGRPLIGEFVLLLRKERWGEPFFHPNRDMFQTDDRGVYRIYGLPAGNYTVSVGASREEAIAPSGFMSTPYVRTFYPGVTDKEKATVIEVTAGSEATGIDIKVGTLGRVYKAAGRVVDAETGRAVANVFFGCGIKNENTPELRAVRPIGRTNSRGEFQITGLMAGRYVAFADDPINNYYSDPVSFEVADADATGIEIKIRRGGSISGLVVIEDADDKDSAAKLTQMFLSAHVLSETISSQLMPPAKLSPDGSFQVTGLRPGKARIFIRYRNISRPVPVRVERNGVEQLDGIDIGPGEQVTGVRLFINAGGTNSIRGQVNIIGGTLDGIRVMVNAYRAGSGPQQGRQAASTATVDSRGRFSLEGLAVGEYEVWLGPMTVIVTGAEGNRIVRRMPTVKQSVTVTNGPAPEITLTVDLTPKDN